MRIVICTQGLPFDGNTLKEKAMGGSETAVICVAHELHKLGHQVTVYNNCKQEGYYDGVEYINIDGWGDFVDCGYADIAIVSRFVQMFGEKLNTKLNILWNHDILPEEMKNTIFSLTWNIDYMYCLSEYHKEQYLEKLPELNPMIKLNTNGIDFDLIPERTEKKHKIMFTSRPERGLYTALNVYEKVADKELELVICNYNSIMTDEVKQIEKMCAEKIQELVNDGYNIGIGQFTKEDLYKHISESKAVIYTSEFPEISCISAIEAQACGTAYICTHDFALKETVGYDGIKLNKDYEKNFIKRLKEVLGSESIREDIENIGIKHAEKYTWSNVAKKFIADAEAHFKTRSNDVNGVIDRLLYESDIVVARETSTKHAPERLDEINHLLRHLDNPETQKEIYEDEETHESIDLDMETFEKIGRFVWASARIKEYGCKSVLDFACHMGASSIKISNDNPDCKMTGYDLSESAIDKACKRKDMLAKTKDNITFTANKPGPGAYDGLFNGEMLEHVLDPEGMVDELETYVKKGGKMFITVPKGAWEWLSRDINKEKDVVYHVNHFDGQDIQDMFGKKKDFKVLTLPVNMVGAYGEKLGNYMVEYTVDGTPTGKRDFERKRLTTRPHQSISLCMIGKDAEKTIETTLDSLKDAHGNMIPDEIILLDDNSKTEVMANRAMAYGAIVKSGQKSICEPDLWGFANARNHTTQDAKGKWILWVDTDEKCQDLQFARKYTECGFQNAFVIRQFLPQRDNYTPADSPQRLYRKDKGKFYGYIHEQAQSDINNAITPALILDGAEIWNMGSAVESERRLKAMERNLPLLNKDWKENVLDKIANKEEYRKLTPILVIRDLFNRIQQTHEAFGTYDTREVHERIMPRIIELKKKYIDNETDTIYINIAEKVMQQVYEVLKLGHDIDMIIDGKTIKKRYVDLDDFIADLKKV
ncbi:MAG: methyltransferase [bacterium]|nr:methyltransferase [bacterium]